MPKGLLWLFLLVPLSASASGTPFFQSGEGYEFADGRMSGAISADGLLLSFSTGEVVRWRPATERPWRVRGDSQSGTARDFRQGRPGVEVPAFSKLAATDGQTRLFFERTYGGLKATIEARGVDEVRFTYEGALDAAIEEGSRSLRVQLPNGVLREEGLLCFERGDHSQRAVPCFFDALSSSGDGRVEYRVRAQRVDRDATLVIDPVFVYTQSFGGSIREYSPLLARAPGQSPHDFVMAAMTTSGPRGWNPTGQYANPGSGASDGGDAFVDFFLAQRQSADAGFQFWLVGGDSADEVTGLIAVQGAGSVRACVSGYSFSTPSSLQSPDGGGLYVFGNPNGGSSNAFLWCGEALDPSRFILIGGTAADRAYALAAVDSDTFVIAGSSSSATLPVANCSGCGFNSNATAFIGVVDPTNPGSTILTLYPKDGGSGRFTSLRVTDAGVVAAGIFGLNGALYGRTEVVRYTNVFAAPVAQQVLTGAFRELSGVRVAENTQGDLYLATESYAPVTGVNNVLSPFQPNDAGESDGVFANLDAYTLQPRWLSHFGGNYGDVPLAITTLNNGDAIIGGYTRSEIPSSLAPIGRSPVIVSAGASVPQTNAVMFLTQLRPDGAARSRLFYGGPIQQDQVRDFLFIPSTDGGLVDQLYVAMGLQGINASGSQYPNVINAWPSGHREIGISLLELDRSIPVITITPDTLPDGPASFSFSAQNQGPSGLRAVDVVLRRVDTGATQPQSYSPNGAAVQGGQLRWLGAQRAGQWRASVTAVSGDGYERTELLDFTVTGAEFYDAGTPSTEDGGASDGGIIPGSDGGRDSTDGGAEELERGLSPVGFNCSAADVSLLLPFIAAFVLRMLSRRAGKPV